MQVNTPRLNSMRPLQDGIKDLSLLHPVTVPNCLTHRTLVMTLMLQRVRNCRHYYYYYYLPTPGMEGRVDLGYWLVVMHRDGLPAHGRSPIQLLTRQCTAGS